MFEPRDEDWISWLNRREFLRATAAAIAAPFVAGALAGCDSEGAQGAPPDGGADPDAGASDADAIAPDADGGPEPHINPEIDPDVDGGEVVDWDPMAATLDETLFPMGVQSGAARTEDVLLWGFADDAQPKTLRVWRAGADDAIALVKDLELTPNAGGFFKTLVEGLAPATAYRFAWFTADLTTRSRVGRFSTAWPPGWKAPLTIAALSCTSASYDFSDTLEALASNDYEALCHLGDWAYCDGDVTLDEYRKTWRENLTTEGYKSMLAVAPHYSTWDDHEVDDSSNYHEILGAHLAAAHDAFFEHTAVPRREDDRFWDSYRWGDVAEIFVLDCRSERDVETINQPDATYVSQAQFDWLVDGVNTSPCQFKIVLTSVPIANLPDIWTFRGDRWQGYGAQRTALLDALVAGGASGIYFVAGDFHLASVHTVDREGPHAAFWEVLVGHGGSFPNPMEAVIVLDPDLADEAYPPEMFQYHSNKAQTVLLTCDPFADTLTVRFVAKDGSTPYEVTLPPA